DKIGRSRMGAIVCDSTGNTRLHRELVADEIPTLFNLPDIVHFISNTIKDIVRLPCFGSTITILRATITKFHKSHLGDSELKIAHSLLGIRKGLDAIGKTRFGTVIIAAWSLQLNIPSIRKIVERGKFDIGENLASHFRGKTRASLEFEFGLSRLIDLGSPALKALTCLEANEATPGDVYIFWHAMIWAMKEALMNPDAEYSQEVQEQVLGILNSRHDQIFGSGNLATAANLYLSGVYLDPTYLQSDLF
ncbi:ribonuclease H-like domain-containing protein, partial [Flammula alnicola]